ncbi:MAG: DNA/RNA non-specific endonuclease [Opitutaceae bacterium]|nr:DNA/RNA non-specific endonuclease [Opitutaceae bacterium]
MPRFLLTFAVLLAAVPSARALIGAALQAQLGNPSGATVDPTNRTRYLIPRAQYALDYNDTAREPSWVAWNLTTGDIGPSGRRDFATDTSLPAGFRRVVPADYTNSGFDRGHMCPSGDRTITDADNDATFLMSNIIPQTPDHNQGVWASFETYCRALANAGHELLIVCGPGGFAGATIASGVAIPGFAWKIVVVVPVGPGAAATRITASTRVIALKIPNIAGIRGTPWQSYLTSPAQIEADTGLTFFTELPAPLRAMLRIAIDGQATGSATQRLGNLSARATAGAGAQAAFAGFVLAGGEPRAVLVRAAGPALRDFGVTTALAAPRVELFRSGSGTPLASNTGWANAPELAQAAATVGAFPFAAGSADSALVATLAAGDYTAVATAADTQPGIGLVEIYELTPGPVGARLVNLSARANVGAGDATLIAGLVVRGDAPKRLLVRAAGPALAAFGVSDALARPQLALLSGNIAIATNAGWATSPDAAALTAAARSAGAFPFPAGSADAALLATVAPGAYTAQVTGAGGATGATLLEIYEVP